ncbi:Os09g0100750, partial [Oryza sativa Japonica Group]
GCAARQASGGGGRPEPACREPSRWRRGRLQGVRCEQHAAAAWRCEQQAVVGSYSSCPTAGWSTRRGCCSYSISCLVR